MKCPNCKTAKGQVKNALNPSGSHKYRCNECKTVHTPEPKPNGYPPEIRLLAIRMYVEGNSYNAIAWILKINPQSVVNWVQTYTAKLPAAPFRVAGHVRTTTRKPLTVNIARGLHSGTAQFFIIHSEDFDRKVVLTTQTRNHILVYSEMIPALAPSSPVVAIRPSFPP
jgi:hypothetical protein